MCTHLLPIHAQIILWLHFLSGVMSEDMAIVRINLALSISAPEVLAVYPYGHTADWWSLGILMYAMLVGKVSSES